MRCCVTKTYPQLRSDPRRLVWVVRVWGDGVVVKCVGRLCLPGILYYAGVVLAAQETQDAIGFAAATLHKLPMPAQVIQKDY
jgi:hypothetical protein